MQVRSIAFILAAAFAGINADGQTNHLSPSKREEQGLQRVALESLIDRYPNMDPRRFEYRGLEVTNKDEVAVTFTDGQVPPIMSTAQAISMLRTDSTATVEIRPHVNLTRYIVRLNSGGELEDILRIEQCDGGILKIFPAPFDRPFPVNPPPAQAPIIMELPRKDSGIIIIRPEGAPQSAP